MKKKIWQVVFILFIFVIALIVLCIWGIVIITPRSEDDPFQKKVNSINELIVIIMILVLATHIIDSFGITN